MEAHLETTGILKESNIPEGIGIADDSGFASIGGSSNSSSEGKDVVEMSIGQDIKFKTLDDVDMEVNKGAKRKVKSVSTKEEKMKATEKFNNDKREQTYKRLMHLLTKSQFYSKYIVEKINIPEQTKKSKKGRPKIHKDSENDENNPPRVSNRARKPNPKYHLKNQVSSDMKKKLNDHNKKMNLSQEEIEAQLGDQSDSEEKASDAAPEFVQPKYFHGDLRDYQIEGLQWLKVLYENGVNGILADEMGLGKTIQVIALYAHLLEKRQDGPYLIIAPLSTIPNWMMEFEKFAPQLPVVLYHGTPQARVAAAKKMKQRQNIADGYKTYPIMITTFEVPIMDQSFMASFKWRYIVIDEGHRIKNHECQLLQVLKRCDSMNRLLLTGTPLQNNLAELWSLLNFLLPEIFDDLAVFESWFDAKELQQDEGTQKVLKQEEEKQVLSTLREILKPFMLRRIKEDVCLDIPPKKELVVYAPLTELQYDLYRAVLNRDLVTLLKIEEKPLIIDDGPTRPKRRCVTRNMRRRTSDSEGSSGASTAENDENSNSMWDLSLNTSHTPMNATATEKCLMDWGRYTDVNARNQDFLVHLKFSNRVPMYRMIVNHPFLLHCPLDVSGLPEISENLVKASGKLLVLDAMLTKLKAGGHKVLLFSTSTMLLDLLADYLTLRPWKFLMLDGRHNIAIRQDNIKLFNTDPEYFLFLISTRAGGVGLNLASADTVIIYDSDWNPQMDLQAMARCHRIGQTRPVVIYRLCTKGTIDEQMIARAEAKRKLEKMVISKKSPSFDSKDGLSALKELLESTEQVVVQAEKEVYTDAELDKILDRSDLVWKKLEKSDSDEESDG